MFGLNQNGANLYAKVSMETGVLAANPNKLIVMLYEGAITACRSAIEHMQQRDIVNKGNKLTKAILIIENGLRASLDKKAGGEVATSLDALYGYMSMRLMQANIRNKPELVIEVITLLASLKEAWEQIEPGQAKTQSLSETLPNVSAAKPYAVENRNIASYAKV